MKTAGWWIGIAAVFLTAGTLLAAGPVEMPVGPPDGALQVQRELPAELQAKLDAVRDSRATLLEELKALLEKNAGATTEERRAIVEQWREDHADGLAQVREAMQAVRQEIREWWMENRPVPPNGGKGGEDAGLLGEQEGEAFMAQLKEQHQAREQARLALKQELGNAATEQQRREIVMEHRAERMQQMEQARNEIQVRREQTDRDASVAALRTRLQESADLLRTQDRLRDRDQAAENAAQQDQATVRDGIRINDRDRVSQ